MAAMTAMTLLLSLPLIMASKPINESPIGRSINVDYGMEHPLTQLQEDFSRSRRLSDFKQRYQPIRIHLRLSDINPDSYGKLVDTPIVTPSMEATKAVIQKVIIPAVKFLEDTVRVVRAVRPLHLPSKKPYISDLNCFTRNVTASKDLNKRGGLRVSNADLVVNVRAHENEYPNARSCYYDQFDRTIFASIDLTTGIYNDITGKSESSSDLLIWYRIMIHEMLHTLGILSSRYAYWYDSETGQPRSPRPLQFYGRCGYMIPSKTTIRISPKAKRGPRHYEIATPTVKAVVQAQFNCSKRDFGGRLENYGDCFGDHFDSRWFQSEIMSDGQQISFRDISPLSLAALEDTGWYLVNYNKVKHSPMGRGASCEFLFEDCLNKKAAISSSGDQIFCNYKKFVGCSLDLKTKAICSLQNLTHQFGEKVPKEFNYFDNAAIGSLFMESTDFCPLYARYSRTFNDHYSFNCTNSSQTETAMKFEVFGPESKCVESSIPNSRFKYNISLCREVYGCPTFPMSFNVPLCLNVRCNLALKAVEIRFGKSKKMCKFDGQKMEIPKFPGAFIRCPRLASVCMDFICPKNCAGRGKCDYSKAIPTCICNDRQDSSPFCGNSPRFKD